MQHEMSIEELEAEAEIGSDLTYKFIDAVGQETYEKLMRSNWILFEGWNLLTLRHEAAGCSAKSVDAIFEKEVADAREFLENLEFNN